MKRTDLIEIDGVTQTAEAWATQAGVSLALVSKRVCQGWAVSKALTTRRVTRVQHSFRITQVMHERFGPYGRLSPDFVPGRRKPRADRLRTKTP